MSAERRVQHGNTNKHENSTAYAANDMKSPAKFKWMSSKCAYNLCYRIPK